MWVGRGVVLLGVVALACAGRSQRSDDSRAGESGSSSGATSGNGGSSGSASGGASSGGSSSATGGVPGGGSGGSQAAAGGSAGSTATGGSSGDGTTGGSGGANGGSSGTAGQGEPRPCNSSEGSGCNDGEVCLDITTDSCAPNLSEDCSGYCAPTLPPPDCDGLAQCLGTVTCPAIVEACPAGLARSIVDECFGPCVPVDCCGCSTYFDCQLEDASCNLQTGRCVVPAAPEPRCLLPFDPGPCDGAGRVFAFVDGRCQERTWGLCEGNDNRFYTLEECLRRCEGVPQQGECPEGREKRQTCLACGAAGGCAELATVCAKRCEGEGDCDLGLACFDSFCGVNFCF